MAANLLLSDFKDKEQSVRGIFFLRKKNSPKNFLFPFYWAGQTQRHFNGISFMMSRIEMKSEWKTFYKVRNVGNIFVIMENDFHKEQEIGTLREESNKSEFLIFQ